MTYTNNGISDYVTFYGEINFKNDYIQTLWTFLARVDMKSQFVCNERFSYMSVYCVFPMFIASDNKISITTIVCSFVGNVEKDKLNLIPSD